MKNSILLDKILLVIYNILFLLVPVDLNIFGVSYSKLLFAYSLVIFLYLKFYKKGNVKKLFSSNKTFKFISIGFFVFFLSVITSIIINSIIDKNINISNFYEILRVVLYYLIFFNFYNLLNKKNLKTFNISMIVLIFFNVILAFFQFHNIFGLNELYVKYIASTQYETLINGYKWPRAVALAGNPNVLGFLLTLFSIYILFVISKNYKKFYYYIIYLLILISVFLSASRTSYIALVFSNVVYIFLLFFKFKKKDIFKTFSICTLFLILHVLILFLLPNSYTWRIKTIINFQNESSWQKREDMNQEFIENIKNSQTDNNNNNNNNDNDDDSNLENNIEDYTKKNNVITFIIGNGPDKDKNKHEGYFDNEWFKIFFNYGFLGILSYLFMMILPIFTIKKNRNFNYSLYVAIIIANFIYMLTSASYHSYLLFGITMILFSLSLKKEIN